MGVRGQRRADRTRGEGMSDLQTVYVVIEETGEYSGRAVRPLRVFADEERAQAYVRALGAEGRMRNLQGLPSDAIYYYEDAELDDGVADIAVVDTSELEAQARAAYEAA